MSTKLPCEFYDIYFSMQMIKTIEYNYFLSVQANIRAKKREEFRQQLQEKTVEDITESTFFDPRISAKPNIRTKRALRFHEPGKFQQLADRMRMKVGFMEQKF